MDHHPTPGGMSGGSLCSDPGRPWPPGGQPHGAEGKAEARGSEVDGRSPQALMPCVSLREARGPRTQSVTCNRKRRVSLNPD